MCVCERESVCVYVCVCARANTNLLNRTAGFNIRRTALNITTVTAGAVNAERQLPVPTHDGNVDSKKQKQKKLAAVRYSDKCSQDENLSMPRTGVRKFTFSRACAGAES